MRMRFYVLFVHLALAPCASVAQSGGFAILLTNDDGFDAPGITTLRQALVGAGHDVTVVAPLSQQSGSGMKITLGPLKLAQASARVWTVAGTPIDAVAIGLTRVLAATPPDLVVSGTNLGQNLGANTNSSGTVGAAVMAMQLGVPAIAISAGLDLRESGDTPQRFTSTIEAFPDAASLVVNLIARLARSRGRAGALLPPGIVLNVNYPLGELAGVKIARRGDRGGFAISYAELPDDAGVMADLVHETRSEPRINDADTSLFAQGYVTISVLDGNWDAGAAARGPIAGRIADLLR